MPAPNQPTDLSIPRWLPGVCGGFLGLALLKFGNPVVLDHVAPPPAGWQALVWETWPFWWGVTLLAGLLLAGLRSGRGFAFPGLLAFWLGWNCLSALQSADTTLSGATVTHFMLAGGAWALGNLLGRSGTGLGRLWPGLFAGVLLTLFAGAHQHYGGLEGDEKFFQEHEATGWRNLPSEEVAKLLAGGLLVHGEDGSIALREGVLDKLKKRRVFATFVYPNAFAGALLLLAPVCGWWVWRVSGSWPNVPRGVVLGFLAYLAAANLYWTQSKSGWLLALLLGAVAALRLPFDRRLKVGLVAAGLVAGTGAFALKYQAYFARGATSVGARLDYWRAALTVAADEPLLGSGPGTFHLRYQVIKPPEAEMARLAHNDYLQQASDAGWPAFLAYAAFICLSLRRLYPRGWIFAGTAAKNPDRNTDLEFALWLGLLGWALQGLAEFGLYIPALAWSAFFLLGLLAGMRHESDQGHVVARPGRTNIIPQP